MLKETTFVVPLRIESNDRLRNVIVSSIYILDNTDATLIIKESDKNSVFLEKAYPQIKECIGEEKCSRLKHIFDQSEDEIFHRTKIINDMVMLSTTKVVVNYDCDILLPLNSYQICEQWILDNQYDVIYPYGNGDWQYQVFADDDLVSKFINEDYDFSILESKSKIYDAKYGFCQFFSKEKYIEGGLENENFISYGYEDDERFFRFNKLEYKVGRLDFFVYHLEHARTFNSWFTNPHIVDNKNLYEELNKLDKDQLINYYNNQNYLITQKEKLNDRI